MLPSECLLDSTCRPEPDPWPVTGRLGRLDLPYTGMLNAFRQLCNATRPDLKAVEAVLREMHAAMPVSLLFMLLQPVLRESDSRVQSKCYFFLARHEPGFLTWADRVFREEEPRVRANVIEGLWGCRTERAEKLFRLGIDDTHQRVIGNSAYGLFLLRGTREIIPVVERLRLEGRAEFRVAAAWLIRRVGSPELRPALELLRTDRDANVRKSALRALVSIGVEKIAPLAVAPEVVAVAETVERNVEVQPESIIMPVPKFLTK